MPVLAIVSRNVFCCFNFSAVASSSHSAHIAGGVERSGTSMCQHKVSRRGNYAGGLATVRGGVLLWVGDVTRKRVKGRGGERDDVCRAECVFCGFKKKKVVIVVVVFSLLNS